MTFYEQFDLLDLLRDDGVKSFRARELATGRMVEVHVFANSQAPISRALWNRIDKLAQLDPSAFAEPPIIARGDYEGTPYAVTPPLDGYGTLHEWISAMSKHGSPAQPPEVDRLSLSGAGAWSIAAAQSVVMPPPMPDSPPQVEPHPEPPAEAAQPPQQETTREPAAEAAPPVLETDSGDADSDQEPMGVPTGRLMLEALDQPTHTTEIRAIPKLAPPTDEPRDEEHGSSDQPTQTIELRTFEREKPAEPHEETIETEAVETAEPSAGSVGLGEFALGGPASDSDDEEFMRLFGGTPPASGPEPDATAEESAKKQENTGVEAAAGPLPAPPAPQATAPIAAQAPPPPSAKPPGEFTQMLQALGEQTAPTLPQKPAAPAQEPGEFTRMIQTVPAAKPAPVPAAASVKSAQPGEFTQMLTRVEEPIKPAVAGSAEPSTSYTQPAAATQPTTSPQAAASSQPTPFRTLQMAVPPSLSTPSIPASGAPPATQPPLASGAAPAASSGTKEPGEFTKALNTAQFASPARVSPVVVKPPSQQPGEFTRAIDAVESMTPGAQTPSAAAPTPSSPTLGAPSAPLGGKPPSAPPSAIQAPGEFTRAIQAASPQPSPFAAPQPSPSTAPPPGEFTRMLQSPGVGGPASNSGISPGQPGEFTKMWQSEAGGSRGGTGGGIPQKASAIDLGRFAQPPIGPMPQNPAVQKIQPQSNIGAGGKPAGEYTQLFGTPNAPYTPQPPAGGPTPAAQAGASATNSFSAAKAPAYPQYPAAPAQAYPANYNPYDPYNYYGTAAKGEFTQKFSAPGGELNFGKEPPKAPPPAAYGAPQNPYGAPQNPYGAPQNPYGAPQGQAPFGAPAAGGYGAPQPPYGASFAAPQPPYGAPQGQTPYGAPPVQPPYGAPPQGFGAPAPQGYGAPAPYGAAPQPHGQPAPYGAPPAKAGVSKMPLIIGGAGLLIAVILLIVFIVTKK